MLQSLQTNPNTIAKWHHQNVINLGFKSLALTGWRALHHHLKHVCEKLLKTNNNKTRKPNGWKVWNQNSKNV